MRIFLSFAEKDADKAVKLEGALRNLSIEAWSTLDLCPGEELYEAIDTASALADGFVFLLGGDASTNPQMLREWRTLLRNDSESKKALIPIISSQDLSGELPAFLRNRRPILLTANYDKLAKHICYLLKYPDETRDQRLEEVGRLDRTRRLEELKQFALALKGHRAGT